MLRALSEAGVRPDIVVGTSIGAVNGAFVAADPDQAAERLTDLWRGESLGMVKPHAQCLFLPRDLAIERA